MIKKIFLVLCVFFISVNFTACSYVRQVSEMAYVVGIGIDKGENENIILSLQFAKPFIISKKSSEGGGEEKGGGDEKSTSLATAEAEDIFSAISKIESTLSKQINLTHAKILIFSSEIAKEGVLKYAKALMANNQFRPNTFAALSYGGAKEYFEEEKPALESNPAKYYTLMFSKDTKSFLPEASLRDLYFNISTKGQSAVLPVLGGEGEESGGMGVFKEDRLVQLLEPRKAEIYNILSGNWREGYFNAGGESGALCVRLKERRKPSVCVKINGNEISADISLKLSAQPVSYLHDEYDSAKISDALRIEITKRAEEFLNLSKELECDLLGISRFAKKNFLTQNAWEDYRFYEKYGETKISFDVKMKTENGELVK